MIAHNDGPPSVDIKLQEAEERSEATVTGEGQGSGPDCDDIARLAYTYWIEGGKRAGTADDDWYRAERELRRCREPLSMSAHA